MTDAIIYGDGSAGPSGPPSVSQTTLPFTMPPADGVTPVTVAAGNVSFLIQGAILGMANANLVAGKLGSLRVLATPLAGATSVQLVNDGTPGNVVSGTTVPALSTFSVTGPQGTPASSQTALLASFNQPAPGTPITINVASTAIAASGFLSHPVGGVYQVLSVVDTTHWSVTPTASAGNATVGTLIGTPSQMSVSGGPALSLDAYGYAIIPAPGYSISASPTQNARDFATDWPGTAIPGDGAWHTIATIAPPLAPDEILAITVLALFRKISGTPGFGAVRCKANYQNQAGTLFTPAGTQVSTVLDTDSGGSSPTGMGLQAVPAANGVAIQVQSTQAGGYFAKLLASIDRAGAPGAPVVSLITPSYAPANALSPATIGGAGLQRATAAGVLVGGTKYPFSNFAVVGSSTITGTLPIAPIAKGFVYISIGGFDYVSSVPYWFLNAAGPSSDVAISPSTGGTAGGQTVTVTATSGLVGLDIPGFGVTLNTIPSVSPNVASDGSASVVSAPGSLGTANVTISTPTGSRSILNGWTYAPSPTLTGLSIDVGPWEGGGTIIGSGTNLTGATIKVDGVLCTGVVIGGGGTSFSATVPASTGTTHGYYATVSATTTGGTVSLTGVNGYFYLPSGYIAAGSPETGISPASPTDGTLMASWADFLGTSTLVQGTTANKPPYVASSINGQPAIRHTQAGGSGGVPQFFVGTFNATKSPTAFTQIIVGQANATSSGGPWIGTAWATGVTGTGGIFGSKSPIMGLNNGNEGITAEYNSTVLGVSGATPANGTPAVFSSRYDGTNNTTRVNGTDGTPVASAFTGLALASFALCGGDATASSKIPASFDTAFWGYWSKAWVAADYTGFSAYTSHKWNIANA